MLPALALHCAFSATERPDVEISFRRSGRSVVAVAAAARPAERRRVALAAMESCEMANAGDGDANDVRLAFGYTLLRPQRVERFRDRDLTFVPVTLARVPARSIVVLRIVDDVPGYDVAVGPSASCTYGSADDRERHSCLLKQRDGASATLLEFARILSHHG